MTRFSAYVFRRVMRLKVRVHFKQLHWRYIGEQEGREVTIDLKCTIHPAKVFLHECLHFLYPTKAEAEVSSIERKVWKELNRRQTEKLYRKMFGAK